MTNQVLETPETIEMSALFAPGVIARGVTFEEYLTIGEDSWQTEWVDGEVIRMAPTSADHQRIGSFLEKIMGLFAEINGLGEVFRSPFAMKLAAQRRGREPDILFVRQDRISAVKKNYLDGPADLAIEIISPESIKRDRIEKFGEYEAAGIAEFWLIDPETRRADFYVLGPSRRYELAPVSDGIYHSTVLPGLFLRIEWLWQTPSPTIAALRELKLLG